MSGRGALEAARAREADRSLTIPSGLPAGPARAILQSVPSADPKLRLLVRHSDSSKDRALAEELLGHLNPLRRFANLDVWSDARLRAGDETRREIERAIDQADVVLLLLSADFFGSDTLLDVEVPKLMERQRQGSLKVVPVLLRSCVWDAHPWLSELHALPRDGKPVASHQGDDRDRVLTELVKEIGGLETLSNASTTSTPAPSGNPKAEATGVTFVTNITGATLPALAIGPGSQAINAGQTVQYSHVATDSEELARARLRVEAAVLPYIIQHGSGWSPGDNMPIIGCVVENHGERLFRIVGATGRWRFVGEDDWNAAEFIIFQHRTAPGERSTVNAKLPMRHGERSKFDKLLKQDPYQSPVEVDMTVSCRNTADYDGVDRKTIGWPVPPRPVGQPQHAGNASVSHRDEAREDWITSERPYVKFIAPPGWLKQLNGDWGVFISPSGAAVFAFTTFAHPADSAARLEQVARVLGVSDVEWRSPKPSTVGRDDFSALGSEGACNFRGPGGYMWFAKVNAGSSENILLVYTMSATGTQADNDAALASIKSLQRR